MSWIDEVKEIAERRARALGLGGPERIGRQHAAGRMTVRERLDALLDPGSFVELGMLAGEQHPEGFLPSGYVGGLGRIDGRDIAVGGEDFTVRGGSEREGRTKFDLLACMAIENRIPAIYLYDGAGGSVTQMVRQGYSEVPSGYSWGRQVELMGEVPVLAGILGSVAGGPAGRAMLSHFSCMVKGGSELFAAGPPLVKRALGLSISKHDLGGSEVHVRRSGLIDNEAADELDCLAQLRRFLSFMPQSASDLPPFQEPTDRPDRCEEELLSIIPHNRRKPYDMRKLIRLVVDEDTVFEIRPTYGTCVITALARLNGHVVGVLASNPMGQAGALDGPGADKQSEFMELCNYFHIPILYFVDVPGFLIGPDAERSGALKRGMRALWMTYNLESPILQVLVRRSYGIAGVTTGNADAFNLRLAWPSGEWGGLPVEGGVDAAFRREIETAPDADAKRSQLEEALRRLRSPFATAEAFGIEDIIDPRQTRPLLIRFLEPALSRLARSPVRKARIGIRP